MTSDQQQCKKSKVMIRKFKFPVKKGYIFLSWVLKKFFPYRPLK